MKKKISVILTSCTGGGAEKMMINLANRFADKGYTTNLLILRPVGPLKKMINKNVNISEAPILSKNYYYVPWLIFQFLINRPSRILTSQRNTNIITFLAAIPTFLVNRVVFREATVPSQYESDEKGLKFSAYNKLSKIIYPKVKKHIAVSNAVKKDLIRFYEIEDAKVRTIYNPVITPRVIKKLQQSPDEEWFYDSIPVVISAGGIRVEKNHALLIQAIHRVNKIMPCRLLILGEITYRSEYDRLLSLTKSLGINNNVKFTGFVDNPYSYMAKADLFVLSSKFEGFGNVIAEALFCGSKVVSTDCLGGPGEILDNGKYGRLVPVGDEKKWQKLFLQY